MSIWEQDMDMTGETWDAMGDVEAAPAGADPASPGTPSATGTGGPTEAGGPEPGDPRQEQSPKDPWDAPGEEGASPAPEDPWDDPRDPPPPKDPWDDPEGTEDGKARQNQQNGPETGESGPEGQPSDPSFAPAEDPSSDPAAAPPQVARLQAEVTRLEGELAAQDTLAALLTRSAGRMGVSPEEYLTQLRTRELTDLGLSQEGAALQAKLEQEAAEGSVRRDRAAAAEARREADLCRFVAAFPHVSPEAVPKAVWDAVSRGEDLTEAYLRHENEALRRELSALRTQRKNAPRVATSRQDAGGDSGGDGFIAGFMTE